MKVMICIKNGDYILVKAPNDYPGKKYRKKYCYEHYLIYWETYGFLPKNNEIIHHKDENKHNNNPNNLEVMERVQHINYHSPKKDSLLLKMKCPFCGIIFIREKRNSFLVKGGTYSCCSKKCLYEMMRLPKEEIEKRIVGNIMYEFRGEKELCKI